MTGRIGRHRVLVVVAIVIAGGLVVDAGAFASAFAADRPATVDVVDDGDAYLGIDADRVRTSDRRSEVSLIVIANRLGTAVEVHVDVSARSDRPSLENVDQSVSLGPGDSAAITADVVCPTVEETGGAAGAVGSNTSAGNDTGDTNPDDRNGTSIESASTDVVIEITVTGGGVTGRMSRTIVVACRGK